jgi:hypothetical protein
MREIRKRAQNHDWFINSGSWAALCDAVADRRFLLDYIGYLEGSGLAAVEPAERAIPVTRIHERIRSLRDCVREATAGGSTVVAEAHEQEIRTLRSLLDEEHDTRAAATVACAGPAVFGPAPRGPR